MRSRELGPIPRIVDAYQGEFTSRCDHEAEQPSIYETRNRCNFPLHGMLTVNQREHPLDRERRECALTAINDMSFRSAVRNWSRDSARHTFDSAGDESQCLDGRQLTSTFDEIVVVPALGRVRRRIDMDVGFISLGNLGSAMARVC
jgi:hypothetical protein